MLKLRLNHQKTRADFQAIIRRERLVDPISMEIRPTANECEVRSESEPEQVPLSISLALCITFEFRNEGPTFTRAGHHFSKPSISTGRTDADGRTYIAHSLPFQIGIRGVGYGYGKAGWRCHAASASFSSVTRE